MSAAASPLPQSRTATGGWSAIPNSLIENMAVLTGAELKLAMIVLRRGGDSQSVTVSDLTWTKWTGLSSRQKQYAIAGLKQKNSVLNIEGSGENARYSFARSSWDTFVRTVTRTEERARTVGRAVDPKPGAKVHPDCSGECSLLKKAREAGEAIPLQNGLSQILPTRVAQPVAQIDKKPSASAVQSSPKTPPPQNKSSRSVATRVAQPVAQMPVGAALDVAMWPQTLETLGAIFPTAGNPPFLARLLHCVGPVGECTDAELSHAVQFAHKLKAKVQATEGLFLLTVPSALVAIRKQQKKISPAPADPSIAQNIRAGVEKVCSVLENRGGSIFAVISRQLRVYVEKIDDGVDYDDLDRKLRDLESRIVAAARAELTPDELIEVERIIDEEIPQYQKMSRRQRDELRAAQSDSAVLKFAGIPKLNW